MLATTQSERFIFIIMNTHENFLQFNNVELIIVEKDGVDYIALKPILDALGLVANSILKKTRRDRFLGSYTDTVSVQVGKSGENQRRNMTCLPEKYIYGWIGTLNGNSKELNSYKETCYELLYNHFKGTIVSRKGILENIKSDSDKIYQLEMQLKQNDIQKELLILKNKIKKMNRELKLMDKELVKQPELFTED